MKWKDRLLNDLLQSLSKKNDIEAEQIIESLIKDRASLHIAIFNEPFLTLLFSGKKTMESRFSVNSVVPYRKVVKRDLVLVKKSGGPILGFFVVGKVQYFTNLNSDKLSKLETEFGKQLCWNVDPEFISNKLQSKYLTLIEVTNVTKLDPIETAKSDRTGWSVVKLGLQNTLFSNG